MAEPSGRTFICSVVFIDIVRYSQVSIAQQLEMKAHLNEAIADAVAGVVESERIILDTGDGAAICFLGDPEDALFAATAISKTVENHQESGRVVLRTGINLGPIKLVVDLNGRNNVVGDGINVAQRIMSFAEEGEVMVSRSYYEVVARLTEGNERLFRYMGVRHDKHVREHQLYAFSMHDGEDAGVEPLPVVELRAIPGRDALPTGEGEPATEAVVETVIADPVPAIPAKALREEEHRLARYIGPLARVMVARLAPTVATLEELRRALADLIADPADRSTYLAVLGHEPATAAPAPAPPEAAPASPAEAEPLTLDAEEHRVLEHALAVAIGPLARVLVRKALASAPNRATLIDTLAAKIHHDGDRTTFLNATRHLL